MSAFLSQIIGSQFVEELVHIHNKRCSAWLALCEGNATVTHRIPTQRAIDAEYGIMNLWIESMSGHVSLQNHLSILTIVIPLQLKWNKMKLDAGFQSCLVPSVVKLELGTPLNNEWLG